jgi:hypothetical protein
MFRYEEARLSQIHAPGNLSVCRQVWALAAILLLLTAGDDPEDSAWQQLEPGLDYGSFKASVDPDNATAEVRVLRINPRLFDLVLLNASRLDDGGLRTARSWSREHTLLAAINASMYQEDRRTSVSLMKTRTHCNNAYVSKDQCVLAFDPTETDLPQVKLIDRECEKLDGWQERYGTLVQSIRMLSCKGNNVWSQQPRKSSIAAIGMDAKGQVLFIHMSTPHSTHDMINVLKELPLQLQGAMYLEGSAPAQLYIQHPALELEATGSWCSETAPEQQRSFAPPIPNVIGVVRREQSRN